MPTYKNLSSHPVNIGNIVFNPQQKTESLIYIENEITIKSINDENYNIDGNNNTFIFKFNNDVDWTTVVLEIDNPRTASQIVDELNVEYGSDISEDDGGFIRLNAPDSSVFMAIYIKDTGNTANTEFGFVGDDDNSIITAEFPQLRKVSNEPYYNPLRSSLTISLILNKYETININRTSKKVKLAILTGTGVFDIYINDPSMTENLPPIRLLSGNEPLILSVYNRILKLTIYANSNGTILIEEYK